MSLWNKVDIRVSFLCQHITYLQVETIEPTHHELVLLQTYNGYAYSART